MRIDIKQIGFIDEKLRNILVWLEQMTGADYTITSLYRIGDTGVHGTLPLRAIDLRSRSKPVGQSIEWLINNAWQYDDQRPKKKCAILHGQGNNLHLHVQVHENTRVAALA